MTICTVVVCYTRILLPSFLEKTLRLLCCFRRQWDCHRSLSVGHAEALALSRLRAALYLAGGHSTVLAAQKPGLCIRGAPILGAELLLELGAAVLSAVLVGGDDPVAPLYSARVAPPVSGAQPSGLRSRLAPLVGADLLASVPSVRDATPVLVRTLLTALFPANLASSMLHTQASHVREIGAVFVRAGLSVLSSAVSNAQSTSFRVLYAVRLATFIVTSVLGAQTFRLRTGITPIDRACGSAATLRLPSRQKHVLLLLLLLALSIHNAFTCNRVLHTPIRVLVPIFIHYHHDVRVED